MADPIAQLAGDSHVHGTVLSDSTQACVSQHLEGSENSEVLVIPANHCV